MIQTASNWRLAWHAVGWVLIVLVIYLSLTPEPIEVPLEGGDKYGHALAYATLMFWFANLRDGFLARLGMAIGFIAMGIGLEVLQNMTGYRSFQVADMMADAIGVCIGWLAAPPRSPHALRFVEARWPRISR